MTINKDCDLRVYDNQLIDEEDSIKLKINEAHRNNGIIIGDNILFYELITKLVYIYDLSNL